jgi:hypothetical protein
MQDIDKYPQKRDICYGKKSTGPKIVEETLLPKVSDHRDVFYGVMQV